MARYYYTDYVNHMMRLYFKTDGVDLNTDINDLNYKIAKEVIENLPIRQQEMLADIILPDHPIPFNVSRLVRSYGIDEDEGWALLNYVSEQIAMKRGLI